MSTIDEQLSKIPRLHIVALLGLTLVCGAIVFLAIIDPKNPISAVRLIISYVLTIASGSTIVALYLRFSKLKDKTRFDKMWLQVLKRGFRFGGR